MDGKDGCWESDAAGRSNGTKTAFLHLFLKVSLERVGALALLAVGRMCLATVVEQAHDVSSKQVSMTVVARLESIGDHFEIDWEPVGV